jgi:CubicO group peptidase (beta-lactamase class C family)
MPQSFLLQRRRLLAASVMALVAPALGTARAAAGRKPFEGLDAFVAEQMHSATIPGLALGAASNGVVRYLQGYGQADLERRRPVTTETMFHIASVTKTVTATAIMQLVDAGKLDLDEPVSRHLDFPLSNPHHPDVAITARQLLMHTSSISDANYYAIDFRQRGRDSTLPVGDFLKDYLVPGGKAYAKDTCFSTDMPGAAWDYSNVGYGLLGHLASRIGHRDMREQTREHMFAPLGMHHTSWTISGTPAALAATPYDEVDGVLVPAEPVGFPDWGTGMLRSSIADFTRFVAASANGGLLPHGKLVSAPSMAAMLEMKTPPKLPDWLSGQGLGWASSKLDGVDLPNHWGGDPGVFTAVYLDPRHRAGVAIFTNATMSAARRTAVKNIASRVLNTELR